MGRFAGRLIILSSLATAVFAQGVRAQATDPPAPPASTSAPAPVPAPEAVPVPAPEAVPAPGSREALLEERLRKMEAMNQQILGRLEAVSRTNEELSRRLDDRAGDDPSVDRAAAEGGGRNSSRRSSGLGAAGTDGRTSPRETGDRGSSGGGGGGGGGGRSDSGGRASAPTTPEREGTGRNRGGLGAAGTDGRTSPRESGHSGGDNPRSTKRKLSVESGDGLEFRSDDDEFKLVFHDLTQAELRAFSPLTQSGPRTNFFIPRQRWYFVGQLTRDVQFYTSINRGYGSLDMLDAFITLNFLESFSKGNSEESGIGAQGTAGRTTVNQGTEPNRKLRLRVGRTKTPYLYEYFEIAEGDLIAPERSLFAGNLAPNRQIGAMVLGDLFEERLGYAFGVFNGPRRSFEDNNNAKDVFAYLNLRPFLRSDQFKLLQYLNVGGSFNEGYEQGSLQPAAFRTANDQTPSASAATLSPTFLQFNNNVVENGQRDQWSAHAALFYKSFGLLGEYGGGFQNYGIRNQGGVTHTSTAVPFEGYTAQAFYFLTGEHLTRRVNVVHPLNDFGYHKGKFGTGAIEVHARFSQLGLGREIFTAGLADPNLWSNSAYATDVGVNWYLNYYTKIYFDWQHAEFGSPVVTGPGQFNRTSNLYWLRFQVFF